MTETIRFSIAGMTCASCVSRITRALRKVDGVTNARVDLRQETATLSRETAVTNETISAAVASAGYEADLESSIVVPAEESHGFHARLFR